VANTENQQLKFYRLVELDNVAESVLKEASEYLNDCRFDIESFIVAKYGLIIEPFYGLKSNWDTYAFMLVNSNRIFIDRDLLDADKLEKKYRFTLGEEFAHYLIHKDIYSDCKTIEERIKKEDSFTDNERNRLENNARALASALLMPKRMVEDRVVSLLKDITQDREDVIDYLAKKLSHDFDVNFKAARRRLINLGYDKRLREDIL
jgi:Zn-dependent peptidase ImmA (M78 family)